MSRTVKVNNQPVEIPDNSTGKQVQEAARAVGIDPIVKGAGGKVELRAYHRSGAAILVEDSTRVDRIRVTRKETFAADSFGFTEVEVSNRIGSGRYGYWPASPGRLNLSQIRDAVGDKRIWRIPISQRAISIFRKMDKYAGEDWLIDHSSMIIQNAPGVQFDNYMTVSLSDGERLIELMKWYAAEKRKYWAGATTHLPWDSPPASAYPENSTYVPPEPSQRVEPPKTDPIEAQPVLNPPVAPQRLEKWVPEWSASKFYKFRKLLNIPEHWKSEKVVLIWRGPDVQDLRVFTDSKDSANSVVAVLTGVPTEPNKSTSGKFDYRITREQYDTASGD